MPPRVREIAADVCAQHGVTVEQMLDHTRGDAVVLARWKAINAVRDRLRINGQPPSHQHLARWFERSTGAIGYALGNPAPRQAPPKSVPVRSPPRATWSGSMDDHRMRLAWLYGDADARIEANAPDLEAWRRLGANREERTA